MAKLEQILKFDIHLAKSGNSFEVLDWFGKETLDDGIWVSIDDYCKNRGTLVETVIKKMEQRDKLVSIDDGWLWMANAETELRMTSKNGEK